MAKNYNVEGIDRLARSWTADWIRTVAPATVVAVDPTPLQDFVGGPGDDNFVSNYLIADNFDGGGGSDTVDYRLYGSGVTVVLSQNPSVAGTGPDGDRLTSIENIITGSGNDQVTGSADNNRIETGGGNDFLWGNGGSDTLIGGTGDDVYFGVDTNDMVVEGTNEGIDLIRASAGAYSLPDNVENLVNESFNGGVVFTGNALGNEITRGSYDDRLYGAGGNDILDGLGGYDELYGGIGDDIYVLRSGYDDSGLIVELENEGTDRVWTSLLSYTLPDNVENLWASIATTSTLTYTGNSIANSIRGALGNDVLSGMGGDDLLEGDSGNDTLYGGDGNDFLNGGTGVNALYGGAGDDVLLVVPSSSNTVIDGGDGFDTLRTNIAIGTTVQLASIERVEFISSIVDLTLTGQQVTTGLSSNVNFNGTTGAGRIVINMAGVTELYATNFTFSGNIFIFRINGSTADETVKAPISFASEINGGDGADSIRGGTRVDTLNGGDGNDKVEGGQGADILTGGAGADVFRYQSANASGIGTAGDRISDFVSGTDKLGFLLLDSDPNTVGIQGFSYIDTQAFHATSAAEIRYTTSGGDLVVQLDLNGDGAADMEIFLQGLGGQSLSGGDLLFNSAASAAVFTDLQPHDALDLFALPSAVMGGGVYVDAMAFARFDPASGEFVGETHGNDWADFAIGHLLFENHIPTGSGFML